MLAAAAGERDGSILAAVFESGCGGSQPSESGVLLGAVTRLTLATSAIRVISQDSCFGVDTGLAALRMRA